MTIPLATSTNLITRFEVIADTPIGQFFALGWKTDSLESSIELSEQELADYRQTVDRYRAWQDRLYGASLLRRST